MQRILPSTQIRTHCRGVQANETHLKTPLYYGYAWWSALGVKDIDTTLSSAASGIGNDNLGSLCSTKGSINRDRAISRSAEARPQVPKSTLLWSMESGDWREPAIAERSHVAAAFPLPSQERRRIVIDSSVTLLGRPIRLLGPIIHPIAMEREIDMSFE